MIKFTRLFRHDRQAILPKSSSHSPLSIAIWCVALDMKKYFIHLTAGRAFPIEYCRDIFRNFNFDRLMRSAAIATFKCVGEDHYQSGVLHSSGCNLRHSSICASSLRASANFAGGVPCASACAIHARTRIGVKLSLASNVKCGIVDAFKSHFVIMGNGSFFSLESAIKTS